MQWSDPRFRQQSLSFLHCPDQSRSLYQCSVWPVQHPIQAVTPRYYKNYLTATVILRRLVQLVVVVGKLGRLSLTVILRFVTCNKNGGEWLVTVVLRCPAVTGRNHDKSPSSSFWRLLDLLQSPAVSWSLLTQTQKKRRQLIFLPCFCHRKWMSQAGTLPRAGEQTLTYQQFHKCLQVL